MKKRSFLLCSLIALLMGSCGKPDVRIDTPQGELVLTPLADNAVRVQILNANDSMPQLEELIYT